MPSHPDRVRSAPLPAGYQFGDALVRALTLLPDKPILAGLPQHVLVVEVQGTGADAIEDGIRELAPAVSQESIAGYARLETPQAVEDVRHYGPVRYHRAFSLFPETGPPRMRGFLTVGLLRQFNAVPPWRRPSDNAAEQLAVRAGWNVIEGEHHDSDAERHPVITGARSDA